MCGDLGYLRIYDWMTEDQVVDNRGSERCDSLYELFHERILQYDSTKINTYTKNYLVSLYKSIFVTVEIKKRPLFAAFFLCL